MIFAIKEQTAQELRNDAQLLIERGAESMSLDEQNYYHYRASLKLAQARALERQR